MTLLVRRILLWLTSLIGAFVGLWAAGAPRSFYDSFPGLGFGPWVAIDGSYNEHLVRDVGALYLALAAGGVFAALTRSLAASRVIGVAWLVFSVPHLGYHLGHLEGMPPLDAIGEVVSLSSTLVLALPLLIGPPRAASAASTTVVAEGKVVR